MFCPNCGRELVASAEFCPHCGKSLAEAARAPGQWQPPLAWGAFTRQVTRQLTEARKVIRLGGAVALFALLLLPQVSCMGQSMTALGLLNLARDFDAMTGGTDLFLWIWIFSVFGGAIWALAAPTQRAKLVGTVAFVVHALFMVRVAQGQGLRLAIGAFVTLVGLALVAFAPKAASWAAGFAAPAGEKKGDFSMPEAGESQKSRDTDGEGKPLS